MIDLRHVGHAVAEGSSTTHWLRTFPNTTAQYRPEWSDCAQVSSHSQTGVYPAYQALLGGRHPVNARSVLLAPVRRDLRPLAHAPRGAILVLYQLGGGSQETGTESDRRPCL